MASQWNDFSSDCASRTVWKGRFIEAGLKFPSDRALSETIRSAILRRPLRSSSPAWAITQTAADDPNYH